MFGKIGPILFVHTAKKETNEFYDRHTVITQLQLKNFKAYSNRVFLFLKEQTHGDKICRIIEMLSEISQVSTKAKLSNQQK